MPKKISTLTLCCSFCGKSRDSVKKLIASTLPPTSSTVCICNDCVDLCDEILFDEGIKRLPKSRRVGT